MPFVCSTWKWIFELSGGHTVVLHHFHVSGTTIYFTDWCRTIHYLASRSTRNFSISTSLQLSHETSRIDA
jgi:hypothetical protein